ncbi:MAG: isochorismatase family cysteine hydrolase [bacterium]
MRLYPKMNSQNTALMVIDVLNSCAHENCEIRKWNISFSKIREMIPNLTAFIEKYREIIGGLIIFTKNVPWIKENLPENLNNLYKDPEARYYSEDNSGFAEQFYQVKPLKNDLIVEKHSYDGFTNPKLEKELKTRGIEYLVVAGLFGDGCVMSTICNGFSKGYNFIILNDLIETTDVPLRQSILEGLKDFTWPKMYGKTTKSKDFLRSWD